MLQTIEKAMKDKRCAVRFCFGDIVNGFAVSAVDGNGTILASGYGETLTEAVRDMLEDFGILAKEEPCTATA